MASSADPAAAPAKRHRVRNAVALAVLVALVTASVVVSVTDWRWHPRQAYARYLPPDGGRVADGVDGGRVTENALIPPPWALESMPATVAGLAADAEVSFSGLPFQQWWRSTTTGPDGQFESRVFNATAAGLRLSLRYTGDRAALYRPALPVLPDEPVVGTSWTEEGTVHTASGAAAGYRFSGAVSRPTDPAYADQDCLAVRTELTTEGAGDVERLILCAGQGLVDVLPDGAERSVRPPYPTPPADGAPGPPRRWSPERWTLSDLTPETTPWGDRRDAERQLSRLPPVLTTGGWSVVPAGQGFDIVGAVRGPDAGLSVVWRARPGGRVTHVRPAGRVVLVTTDRRELLAYAEDGRWLWRHQLPAISLVAPVVVDPDRFAVVLKDGRLELRETATGAVRWTARTNGLVVSPLAADPASGTAYALDESGRLIAFGPEGLRWSADLDVDRARLAVGGGGVVVRGRDQASLVVDGQVRWTITVAGEGEVGVAGSVVVTSGDGSLTGLDLTSGTRRWTRAGDGRLGTDGHLVVLAGSRSVLALRPDGTVVAEAAYPPGLVPSLGATRSASGESGVVLWWGPGPPYALAWEPQP